MKFPKRARLLKPQEFMKIYQEKNRFVTSFFYLDYRTASTGRLGISVSKSFGKAHVRNRFKRLIREAFREKLNSFPPFEINIIPKKEAQKATLRELKNALFSFQKSQSCAK